MSRRLTEGEAVLAQSVFGEAIDLGRVRIATRPGGGPAVVIGSWITFPRRGLATADFSRAGPDVQAWLIHELTHVWQFQTAPWRTLASWARTLAGGGYGPARRGYRYRVPLRPWPELNLEQQASVIEHAFLMRQTGGCPAAPAGACLDAYAACAPFQLTESP